MVRWEFSVDGLVVLLGFYAVGQGAGQCGVDFLLGGGAAGAWRRSRVPAAGVPRSGPQWLGGYGAGLHGVVGFLRFLGLLVGVWAQGRGCQ